MEVSCIVHVVQFTRDRLDLTWHDLSLMLIVTDLIVKTNFETDAICEYEQWKFLIKEISENGKNLAWKFQKDRLRFRLFCFLLLCQEHVLEVEYRSRLQVPCITLLTW